MARFLVSVALAALALAAPAKAAQITPSHGQVNDVVSVIGEIVPGDADRLASAMAVATQDNRNLVIMLNSPGGRYDESVAMAKVMRAYRMSGVHVFTGAYGMCASACVTLFAMGEKKGVFGDDTEVSVHTVGNYDDDGNRLSTAAVDSMKLANFLKAAGAPESVIGKLVTNLTGHTTPLTHDELAAWGAEFVPTNK